MANLDEKNKPGHDEKKRKGNWKKVGGRVK